MHELVKELSLAMDILSLLNKSELFKGVSEAGKIALAAIAKPRTLNKREFLFIEGEQGRAVYLLASGNIQLFRTTAEGKEVVIKVISPGELFAEVILFEADCYPVNAMAVKKSVVYEIPRNQFHSLLDDSGFRNDFLGMLMKKQRYLVSKIMSLSVADVRERFFRFIAGQYGYKERYEGLLSKKDVAAAIGANPETLSRLLLRLREEGDAVWEGDVLQLRPGFWDRTNKEFEEDL